MALKKSEKLTLEEATRLAILGKLPLKENKEVKTESTTVTTTDDNLTMVETDDANIVIEPKDNAAVDVGNPVEDVCTEPVCTEPEGAELPVEVPEETPAEAPVEDVEETEVDEFDESKKFENKRVRNRKKVEKKEIKTEGEANLFKKRINKVDIKKQENKEVKTEGDTPLYKKRINKVDIKKQENKKIVESNQDDKVQHDLQWLRIRLMQLAEDEYDLSDAEIEFEKGVACFEVHHLIEGLNLKDVNELINYIKKLDWWKPEYEESMKEIAEQYERDKDEIQNYIDKNKKTESKKIVEDTNDLKTFMPKELENDNLSTQEAIKILNNLSNDDLIKLTVRNIYMFILDQANVDLNLVKDYISEYIPKESMLKFNKDLFEENEEVASKSKRNESKKVTEGEAPLFKKKINRTDIKKVENKVQEARRNPLAKVGNTINREYGRNLRYPDELYALSPIFYKITFAAYDKIESENSDNYDEHWNVIDDERYIKDAKLSKLQAERDINKELERRKIPMSITLGINGIEDGTVDTETFVFVITDYEYHGYNPDMKNYNGDINEDIHVIKEIQETSHDRDEYNSLRYNIIPEINSDYKIIQEYQEEIQALKDKLSKTKNYNQAKKLQKRIDELEEYTNDRYVTDRQAKINGIKEKHAKTESKKIVEGTNDLDKLQNELSKLQDELRGVDVSKLSDKEYAEFKKKADKMHELINKIYDIRPLVEAPKRHVINRVDLRKVESKKNDLDNKLKTKISEGLNEFAKKTYSNAKEVKVEKVIKLSENKLYVRGNILTEKSTMKFNCKLVPIKENKSFIKYTIRENKQLKITEGKTSKGRTFEIILKK